MSGGKAPGADETAGVKGAVAGGEVRGGEDAGDATGDEQIILLIDRAVHEPFRRLWARWRRESWREVRGVLARAASAHAEALAELREGTTVEDPHEEPSADVGPGEGDAARDAMEGESGGGLARGGTGAASERDRSEVDAAEEYRRWVTEEVLAPLAGALGGAQAATDMEEALAGAGLEAAALAGGLPKGTVAALEADGLARTRGAGWMVAAKAAVARALPDRLRPKGTREVPVRELARWQLARVTAPHQREVFRAWQRSRVAWLHNLERAWAEWCTAAFADGSGGGAIEAGEELQSALAGLLEEIEAVDPGRDERLDDCVARLRAEVAVAGTWVGRRRAERGPGWRRLEEEAARWDRRAGECGARVVLCRELLGIRAAVEDASRSLRTGWEEATAAVAQRLGEIGGHLAAARERVNDNGELFRNRGDRLEEERGRIIREISEVEGTLADPAHLATVFRKGVEAACGQLWVACEGLPEALVVHPVPAAGVTVRRPGRAGVAVPLRALAAGAFNSLWRGRLRALAAIVPTSMRRVLAVVAELREVAAYGYEAALQELAEGAEWVAGPESANGMAADGLQRAEALFARARAIVREAVEEAAAGARAEFAAAVKGLYRRATADPLGARWLDLRSRLAARMARGRTSWRDRAKRVAELGMGVGAGVRGRLWPVRRALGIGADEASRAALRDQTRAAAEDVAATLPVLYRRLFSLEPVTDPRLLAGRAEALATLGASCERWKRERNGSVMVIAQPGAGVTSFLNVASRSLAEALPGGIRKVVRDGCREEAPLAALLGGWLGVGPAADLDELAVAVLGADEGRLPGFVILEGIEHLHLRVPGGGRLFERVADFAAKSSPKIFWVLSMAASAWQLARKRSPTCVSDLDRIELAELGVGELRGAILARHRLSGIPLRFAQPVGGRQMLMRRVRGIAGPARNRQFTESDYFQRLHRASLGSIRNALLHWLRSADFRSVEGTLLVRPLAASTISLAALETDQAFALKALLDHGSLTACEYGAVARLEDTVVRHRFRALAELNLIEAVPGTGEGEWTQHQEAGAVAIAEAGEGAAAGREARYRIRPFMVGVVANHLRSANILH